MDHYSMREEMEQAEKRIQSSILEWSVQMNYVREAFDSYIACMETKAKGETAESVSIYIEEVHKYLLNQFYSLFAEINTRIVQYVEEIPEEFQYKEMSSEIIKDYEMFHLTEDFSMMEKMMDGLENLIVQCRGISASDIGCYQKGNRWEHEEVWKLEQLAEIRECFLRKNKTAIQKAMRTEK